MSISRIQTDTVTALQTFLVKRGWIRWEGGLWMSSREGNPPVPWEEALKMELEGVLALIDQYKQGINEALSIVYEYEKEMKSGDTPASN